MVGGDAELDDDAAKIGEPLRLLHGRGRGSRRLGLRADASRCSTPSTRLRDVRDLAAFLGEFERIGGSGLFGSYVDTDGRNSDRYLVNLVQGGLGLPDESYYRDEKFAEIREKYVAYLDPHASRWSSSADPAGRRRDRDGRRDPAGRRATGSAPRPATSRRPTT